jgi:acyl-CoA thioesterase-1
MYQEEPILFDENRTAILEYSPIEVLRVSSSDGIKTYREGVDFTVKAQEGLLLLTPNTSIPHLKLSGGAGSSYERFVDVSGTPLFFSEGHVLHDHQEKVCYMHEGKKNGKPLASVPLGAGTLLHAVGLLKNQKELNIVLAGDSISCGANASAITGVSPFQAPYYQQVVEILGAKYGADVHFRNFSKGGMTSDYLTQVLPSILHDEVDVFIIAFGMNDATTKLMPARFRMNLESAIREVRQKNPGCEVILVASMLPNPSWSLANLDYHRACLEELRALARSDDGIVVVDCQTMSAELFRRKRYSDYTGNNINHPNDWMHSLYAEQVLACFQ